METNLLFGMNVHHGGYQAYPSADLEKNIDACKEMGLDIVRFNQSCGVGNVAAIEEVKRVADLCHARGMKLMHCVDNNFWNNDLTLEELEMAMYEHYRYLSSMLRDKVDYYQLFNEMDVACMNGQIVNIFLPGKDGKEKGEYDCVRWDKAVAAVKGALRGMMTGYPEGKTCINFGWWHTALIYELYDQGCRWDITGLDWYEDCEAVSSVEALMNDVSAHIPDCDFMICETNFWMNLHGRYSEEQKAALKNAETRDANQAKWVPEFVDKLIKINNPKLKAVIFYELMDEPAFEEHHGSYHGESHFGFISCDRNGQNRKEKPVFYSLQKKIKEVRG